MAVDRYPAVLFHLSELYSSHAAKRALGGDKALASVLFSHVSGDFSGTPPDIEAHNYSVIQRGIGVVLNRIPQGGQDFEVATSLPGGITYIKLWSEPAPLPSNFQSVPYLREKFPVQPPKATP